MAAKITLAVRELDDRVVPATVVHYTDVDGDLVTVRTSSSTDGKSPFLLLFDATQHQLLTLKLFSNASPGSSISITATPGPTGGDGLVNVGYIDATGKDLGRVSVHGDLGRIDAGTGGPGAVAVRSLSVMSMGRFGTTTQGPSLSLFSNLHGALGSLTVHGDLDAVSLLITGPNGRAGPIHVGGSLIGGGTTGSIRTDGAMGPVSIGGDLVGSGVNLNGTAIPTGTIECRGQLVGLTIGGSLIGSAIDNSGQVKLAGVAGPIRVSGDLVAGSGIYSGSIVDGGPGNITSVFVGGSLIPGPANVSSALSMTFNTIGSVTVGNNVETALNVGEAATIAVHGSVGSLTAPAQVNVGTVQDLRIGGSVYGTIFTTRMESLAVGGSFHGTIFAGDSAGRILIRGSLVNSYVSAHGHLVPDGQRCVAIGSLTVLGRVEQTQIVVGFDPFGSFGNADGQIGAVTVGGDWVASDLIAGISAGFQTNVFGDADDQKPSGPGVIDQPHSHSRIGPVVIRGQLLGAQGNATTHGIEAEEITSLSIGGTAVPLKAGRSNDTSAIPLGANTHVIAREF